MNAEIYRELLSVAGTPDIPWSVSFKTSITDDYPGVADYYTRYVYNVPVWQVPTNVQHELMAQHYRDIIIKFCFNLTITRIQYNSTIHCLGVV